MAALQDMKMKVSVELNVRVKHLVLYTGSSFYQNNLASACEQAEEDHMILKAILDARGGFVILIFMGVEHGLTDAETQDE